MAAIGDLLRHDLRSPEFSEGYSDSHLATYVATQIKVLREQREMTQSELADKIGTSQTVISRLENISYSSWNIGTLRKLARAFHVRLHVSFETYGSLIDDVRRFSRTALERVEREKDPGLFGPVPIEALAQATQRIYCQPSKMTRRQNQDTTVRLPQDFEGTIKALLKTPPPPAGDPSTRKKKPKKKKAKKK